MATVLRKEDEIVITRVAQTEVRRPITEKLTPLHTFTSSAQEDDFIKNLLAQGYQLVAPELFDVVNPGCPDCKTQLI